MSLFIVTSVLCFSCFERNDVNNINCSACGVQIREKEPEIEPLAPLLLEQAKQIRELENIRRTMVIFLASAIIGGIAINNLVLFFEFIHNTGIYLNPDLPEAGRQIRALQLLQAILVPFLFMYNNWGRRSYLVILIFQIVIMINSLVIFYFRELTTYNITADSSIAPPMLPLFNNVIAFFLYVISLVAIFGVQIYVLLFNQKISKRFGKVI